MIVFLHNDLDAVGCQMCIEEMPFKVTETFYTNYGDFELKANQIIEYAKANNETELLIADLSFAERLETLKSLINAFDKVIHIDHHSYPTDFFTGLIGPKYKCKIDTEKCAAKICYDVFGIDKPHLKAIIDVIDVYDRWVTESPMFDKSQNLNKYFWNKGWENFKQFKTTVPSDYKATVDEILKYEKEGIQKLKDANLIVRSADNSQKITFVFNHDFFNPVMVDEMNQGQDFVVGIAKGIVKFRIRKGALQPQLLEDLRTLIAGKVTGHPLAFTYVIGRSDTDTINEVKRIFKIIDQIKDLPF